MRLLEANDKLEIEWMGLHRWLQSEWRRTGDERRSWSRIFGAVRILMASWLWAGTAGEGPSLRSILPAVWVWSVTNQLTWAFLECAFPLLAVWTSLMNWSDSGFIFLSAGKAQFECRWLPSMLWGPSAKPLFCPDLWDLVIRFPLSIKLNRVKLCSAIAQPQEEQGWNLQKHVHVQRKPRSFFFFPLRSTVMLRRNGMLRGSRWRGSSTGG